MPKTQTPFYVPPGEAPRKLAIERKRRQYTAIRDAKQLNEMLDERGVNVTKIMPNPESDVDFFLALDIFDSTEYEERTLAEWQSLMPLPCTVFMVSKKRRSKKSWN